MKVGLPQALFYWKKPLSGEAAGSDFWKNFFEGLGVEVVLSPESNKEIIEEGVRVSDPEACFASKVFLGHLMWLDDKNLDYIFVPRFKTNDKKLEYCLRFFGMPDLAKILLKTKILSETFDAINHLPLPPKPLSSSESKTKIPLYFRRALQEIGKKLKIEKEKVEKAIDFAFEEQRKLKKRRKQEFEQQLKSEKKKIVLISHPYNLYDSYVNLDTKKKLEKLGAEVIFIDDAPLGHLFSHEDGYPNFHWEFGEEIMRKMDGILKYKSKISGGIEISSFLCGCDAVLKEFVEKTFKENKIPFLYLIIDENTADAGIQTRLEAFMDTIH